MIERSFDLDLLLKVTAPYPDLCPPEDFVTWFNIPRNLMFREGDSIGLATYEFPGMYSVHWYYTVRGKDAVDLGRRMIGNLFENYGAEILRGFVKTRLRHSRWAIRQLGFTSHGKLMFPDGDENELFFITKDEYLKKKETNKWVQ